MAAMNEFCVKAISDQAQKNTLKRNLDKWKTLPAGVGRRHVKNLLEMNEKDLLEFYNACAEFWKKERGWEYDKYSKLFKDCSVLEIGSGLGYDGITYSKFVKKWTFGDIIPDNIELIDRITTLLNIKNVDVMILEDIFHQDYVEIFDGFYAHGVLHHVPFEIAKKEVENISRFLRSGSKVVLLMYPKERWVLCGKPSFEEFGCMTDGKGTPWAEYYDENKVMELFGDEYVLENAIKWGQNKSEFVNFELTKR